MKTPMQEVYENFNLMSDADFKSWMLNTDLLEKEKEVMCAFADECAIECFNFHHEKTMSSEQVFNLTFNTKEE